MKVKDMTKVEWQNGGDEEDHGGYICMKCYKNPKIDPLNLIYIDERSVYCPSCGRMIDWQEGQREE